MSPSEVERAAARAALVGLLLVGCRASALPSGNAGGELAAPPSSFEPIPNVELTTQDGRRVHFYEDLVRGRTVVVQFFFTHCQGVCPLSTGKLVAVQTELGPRFGRDVTFLSITLDPEQDSPAELAAYAREVGARPGWTFLTGAQEDIDLLRRRLGVFELDPVLDADRNQHAGVVVLGNDVKQRWIMKPATVSTRFLTESILRLLEPSGAARAAATPAAPSSTRAKLTAAFLAGGPQTSPRGGPGTPALSTQSPP